MKAESVIISINPQYRKDIEKELFEFLDEKDIVYYDLDKDISEIKGGKKKKHHLVVSVGGDGTVYRTLHLLAENDLDLPLFAINPRYSLDHTKGSIGYRTAARTEDFKTKFEKILNNDDEWYIQEVERLEAKINDEPLLPAINEYVIGAVDLRDTVEYALGVDGKTFNLKDKGMIAHTSSGYSGFARSTLRTGELENESNDKNAIFIKPFAPYDGMTKGVVTTNKNIEATLFSDAVVSIDGKHMDEIKKNSKLNLDCLDFRKDMFLAAKNVVKMFEFSISFDDKFYNLSRGTGLIIHNKESEFNKIKYNEKLKNDYEKLLKTNAFGVVPLLNKGRNSIQPQIFDKLTINTRNAGEEMILGVDGRAEKFLEKNDYIFIQKSMKPARFIKFL